MDSPVQTRCHVCRTLAAEAICHVCKTPRLTYWEQEARYVDAGIRREQRERHEGRSDHDMSTFGTPLKPGR